MSRDQITAKKADNLSALLKFVYVPKSSKPAALENGSSASGNDWFSKDAASNKPTASTSTKPTTSKFEKHALFSDESDDDAQAQQANGSILSELRALYPAAEESRLQEAASAAKDVQHAAQMLMGKQNGTKRALSSQSSEEMWSPEVKRKRVQQLKESQSDADTVAELFETPEERQHRQNESQSDAEPAAELFETPAERQHRQNIDYMADIFPSKSRKELEEKLSECGGVVSTAVEQLSSDKSTLRAATSGLTAKSKVARSEREHFDDIEFESGDEFADDDMNYDSDDSGEVKVAGTVEEGNSMLSLFNSGLKEELMCMARCSAKKADLIISMRPYDTLDVLIEKFQSQRQLGLEMVGAGREMLRTRNAVTRIMTRCQRIAESIDDAVAELGNTDLNESSAQLTRQPPLLNEKMELKPYQMVGLNWLMLIYRQELNGILADEMGLGKTIQTIAFLAQLLEEGVQGPHIIVAPSSTIDNWLRELALWCPALEVQCYYGQQEARRHLRASILDGDVTFNVLVTTYNMATGSEDRVLFKKQKFHMAIFDEGHMLKNVASKRYQNLMRIKSRRRLLLTGTPLQNNLVELVSLLTFVMPQVFMGQSDTIKQVFSVISKAKSVDEKSNDAEASSSEKRSNFEKERIQHAQEIMKPFVLRRFKSQVLKQLPKKSSSVRYCGMTEAQDRLYSNLKEKFSQSLQDGESGEMFQGSSMLMQLRKAANHPLLHRTHYTQPILRKISHDILSEPSHLNAEAQYVFEDLEVMSDFQIHSTCCKYRSLVKYKLDSDLIAESGKFRELDRLLPSLQEQGNRVLIFSQFTMVLDILEVYLNQRNYKFSRLDGSTPVVERQELIDAYNNDDSILVFLLSTKAGGLGINLTAANSVILHDIDFNPYNDKQAEDRCHRVGQTRDVEVIRLISKDTVEEAMLRCANDKLQLEREVTAAVAGCSEDSSKDVASLLREALKA